MCCLCRAWRSDSAATLEPGVSRRRCCLFSIHHTLLQMFSSWWQPETHLIQAPPWQRKKTAESKRKKGTSPNMGQSSSYSYIHIYLSSFSLKLSCVLKGIGWLQYTQNYGKMMEGEPRSFDADVKRRVPLRSGDNLWSLNVVSHVSPQMMNRPFVHQAAEPY